MPDTVNKCEPPMIEITGFWEPLAPFKKFDLLRDPYSYRRVHFAFTVQDTGIHNSTFAHDVQCAVDIRVKCFTA